MKMIRLSILVTLLLGQALAAQAGTSEWAYAMWTASTVTSASVTGGICGVKAVTNDGYDSWDFICPTGVRVYHGSYYVSAQDGWQGPTGFYAVDYRAPLAMQFGESKTWRIYVWGDPGLPGGDEARIRFDWIGYDYSRQFQYTLTLVGKPVGITSGPSVGTTWDLSEIPDRGQSSDPGSPSGAFYLPMFRTANGLEGYILDFTATVIPEPSSLLALLAGLGGLGGIVWRRRVR